MNLFTTLSSIFTSRKDTGPHTIVILEGEKMLSEISAHEEIASKLEFPDYYGKNLAALWDMLTGYIDLPVEIRWIDFEISKTELQEYADRLLCEFNDADGVSINTVD